eukprot:1582154-Pyramimonas_sp.AAC.1
MSETEAQPAPSYPLPQVVSTEVCQHHRCFAAGAALLLATEAIDIDETGNAYVEMVAPDEMHTF